MSGKFITFEGPDGAGKTSVLKAVIANFSDQELKQIEVTREPGGNKISEQIRNIILDKQNIEMDVRTEALLYAAARRQHLVQTILPALNDDKLVLCDRYVDSSVAYQGAGREIGTTEVYEMNRFATEDLLPDHTIYFDIPVEVGLQRINQYRDDKLVDRLDVEKVSFHQKVADGYQELIKRNADRYIIIDATKPMAEVIETVTQTIKRVAPEYFINAGN